MHSWKFTDSAEELCIAEYRDITDKFVCYREDNPNSLFTYDPEEVESLLDRGIWKRVS
jgi:hypothetical protein